MLSKEIIESEKAETVIAVIAFVLVMKNVILLFLQVVFRYRSRIYRTPEHQQFLHDEHQVNEKDDWSFSGRINRCLRNDIEYLPYFLILHQTILQTWSPSSSYILDYNNMHVRSLVYGVLMVSVRCLHNLCFIFKVSTGRILGTALTMGILLAMSLDVCYYITSNSINATDSSYEILNVEIQNSETAIAWITFLLLIKKTVLLIMQAVLRYRSGGYSTPEDAENLHRGQFINEDNDWSRCGRLTRCCRNDAEYELYFLVLINSLYMTTYWEGETLLTHHLFVRTLVYGILMVISRFVHDLCFIFKVTYGRIVSFAATQGIIISITVDICYYMTNYPTEFIISSSDRVYIKAQIALAWILFMLIMKNSVLSILLSVLRHRTGTYAVPEDVEQFQTGQHINESDDCSIRGRIKRCLQNDIEYVLYFLIIIPMICWAYDTQHPSSYIVYINIFERTLAYGIIMVISRYIHNLCCMFKITSGRIAGFILTIAVLVAMSIDICYYAIRGHRELP